MRGHIRVWLLALVAVVLTILVAIIGVLAAF